MKPSAALAHIRQLCALDMDSRVLVPAVLDVLPHLVPLRYGVFFWHDGQDRFTGAYCSDPAICESVSSFAAHPDRYADDHRSVPLPGSRRPKFTGILDASPQEEERFRRTRMFNELMRPFDVHHFLPCSILVGPGSYAILPATRGVGDKPFGQEDKRRLAAILPYLASALRWGGGDHDYVPDGGDGMLIVDLNGRLCHACPRGRHLLHLSVTPDGILSRASREKEERLLAELARSVSEIHSWRFALPPAVTLRNGWGLFRFRAFLLQSGAGTPEHVGIRVEHMVPAALRIMQALSACALSPRQREVALHLSEGMQYGAIAERLGLSPHTVGDIVKEIYARLGLVSRQELRETLLRGELPAAP